MKNAPHSSASAHQRRESGPLQDTDSVIAVFLTTLRSPTFAAGRPAAGAHLGRAWAYSHRSCTNRAGCSIPAKWVVLRIHDDHGLGSSRGHAHAGAVAPMRSRSPHATGLILLMDSPPDRACGAVLARAATRALAGHDLSVLEDLAAPHPDLFPPLDRPGQAYLLRRAPGAQRLSELDDSRGVGEPELRIVHLTRQSNRRVCSDH